MEGVSRMVGTIDLMFVLKVIIYVCAALVIGVIQVGREICSMGGKADPEKPENARRTRDAP